MLNLHSTILDLNSFLQSKESLMFRYLHSTILDLNVVLMLLLLQAYFDLHSTILDLNVDFKKNQLLKKQFTFHYFRFELTANPNYPIGNVDLHSTILDLN